MNCLDNPESYISEYFNIIKPILDNAKSCKYLEKLQVYDTNTFRHSIAVAIIAGAILVDSKNTSISLRDVIISGLFHDIGKIMIDKHIVLGTQKLNPKDRFIVELHPVLGNNICTKLNLPNSSKKGILFHHENYDGTGYPCQKKTDEIPVIARVLRIADVFDALISKRTYKEEVNLKNATDFILNNTKTLFDPEFVNILRKVELNYGKLNY